MPRAEVGSAKHLANRMKSKGLGKLNLYCAICKKQMRDENGLKCHVASESHVRKALEDGAESIGKVIAEHSRDFQRDFLQLLRTSHGTKQINLNHFYQEYIANKEHVHMNATRWPTLTQFGKFLGREGICRVEEDDKGGLKIAWIDNSPEALRRQEANRKKERQDKNDEEREQRQIAEQVERAQREADEKRDTAGLPDDSNMLQRQEGDKLTLSFGKGSSRSDATAAEASVSSQSARGEAPSSQSSDAGALINELPKAMDPDVSSGIRTIEEKQPTKIGLSFGNGPKSKNVFAAASKKNALGSTKPAAKVVQQRPVSEAERIMKEEMQKKRMRDGNGLHSIPNKKIRT